MDIVLIIHFVLVFPPWLLYTPPQKNFVGLVYCFHIVHLSITFWFLLLILINNLRLFIFCTNFGIDEMLLLVISLCYSWPVALAWINIVNIWWNQFVSSRPRWLSWMRRPTGDQEVAGSTPAEVGNILSWRLIMKYFLRSFSPFRWFKKGSCQFLAIECAQYWLTA